MKIRLSVVLASVLTVLVFGALATGQVIGVVVSDGHMQVNQSAVSGNANLVEGSVVKTGAAPARIRLSNGATATLVPESAAEVRANKLLVRSGGGILASLSYPAEAMGFDVAPGSASAKAQLFISGNQLQVAAVDGPVQVRNSEGTLVARVKPGQPIALTPAAGSDRTSTALGLLRQSGSRFTLTDEVTNVDLELRGVGLEPLVGRRVEVTGRATPSADRETQIVEVARLLPVDDQGGAAKPTSAPQAGAAKPGPPQPAPKPPKTGGMSTGAKVGLIAAIGGGAAAGVIFATMSR